MSGPGLTPSTGKGRASDTEENLILRSLFLQNLFIICFGILPVYVCVRVLDSPGTRVIVMSSHVGARN